MSKGYRLSGPQRKIARRELTWYLGGLCHDAQYNVQRSVSLIRFLAMPTRLTVKEALEQLHDELAKTRGRMRWGRPWSMRQLERLYYQKPGAFQRATPHPVTEEELRSWKPRTPPP